MIRPSKPCKYCGSTGHFNSQCSQRPKLVNACKHCGAVTHASMNCFKKPENVGKLAKILRVGKTTARWLQTRRDWFAHHKAESYTCYICEVFLLRAQTTLDHVVPRGSHPELRYEESNLEACCVNCQGGKGSKSLAYYIAERDKHGLHVSQYARDLAARIEAWSRADTN